MAAILLLHLDHRILSLGGSLGYTDAKFTRVEPLAVVSNSNQPYALAQRPKVTGTLWGAYESPPLWGDAVLSFRTDATYLGGNLTDTNQNRTAPEILILRKLDPYWTVNGRLALKKIKIGGVDAEVALWGKNLTDVRERNFELPQELIASANFIPARAVGVDVNLEF